MYFKIVFLEKIISDALDEHIGNGSMAAELLQACGLPTTLTFILGKSRNWRT